jgi:primary-amine oxidase
MRRGSAARARRRMAAVHHNRVMRIVSLFLFALTLAAETAPHPLTPLTAGEIRAAARLVRESGKFPHHIRFVTVTLDEPPKEAVLRHSAVPRRAFMVLYDGPANRTFEAIADLSAGRLASWRAIPGAQPPITEQDSVEADRLVRSDPRFRQALAERGISDWQNVVISSWSAGYFGLAGTDRDRIVRAVPYYNGAGQNYYAHPIEGVSAHVDLTARKILDFLDTDRNAPVSRENFDFTARANTPLRPPPAPLHITQPDGPGFHIEDGEVRWEKWRFRFALRPREGLVLYTVGMEDGTNVRSILYRASLSEMVVPYGDPGAGWFFRNSFDAGELGLGSAASSQRPGVDCPENCTVFEAVMADENGAPESIPGAVALYERDAGIAWKHGSETRRARELVLSFLTEVGNYEYGFDWVFHQDGTLAVRVALSGVMAVKGVADGAHDAYSHPVARNLVAPHHQHFFTFRLDFDVDGTSNRVMEMNSQPAGPPNPYGNAFVMKETPLETERDAQRNLNMASARRWVVVNPSVANALGHPTGYALLPGDNTVPFAQPEAWVRKRAGFLNFHFWATPYRAEELWAGGDYPNQSHGGDGLVQWTAANRSLDRQDVVVWYTCGITHNPRPEDWPVMPVQTVGFEMVPWGFFSRNPVLNLPPPR